MLGEEARQVLLRGGSTVSQPGVVFVIVLRNVNILLQMPLAMGYFGPYENESLRIVVSNWTA